MFKGIERSPREVFAEMEKKKMQDGGETVAATLSMVGGAAKGGAETLDKNAFVVVFLSRAFLHFFILVLAVIFTSKVVTNGFFTENLMNENAASDDAPETFFKRFFNGKNKQFVLALALVVILFIMLLIVYAIVFMIIFIYVAFVGDKSINEWEVTKSIFKEMFWLVASSSGQSDLQLYGYMIAAGTLFFFLIFVIYFYFVKSYFTNLGYFQYVEETGIESEDPSPMQKHAVRMLYIVTVIVLFCIILFLFHFGLKTKNSLQIMGYYIFLIMLLLGFTGTAITFLLQKDTLKSGVAIFVLLVIVILNAKITGLFSNLGSLKLLRP